MIEIEEHGNNPGKRVEAAAQDELVGHDGSTYTYAVTFERDDGSRYRVLQHTHLAPWRLDKTRQTGQIPPIPKKGKK